MTKSVRVRLVVLQVIVMALLVTLVGRLWQLQMLSGERYAAAASENRVREVVIPAVRGQVLDAAGLPLVRNRTSMVVSVSRTALLKQPDDGAAVLARLAAVLKMPLAEVKRRTTLCGPGVPKPCHSGSPYQPIPVTTKATTQMALSILEHREDFPGVTAELAPVRDFPAPLGVNAAHVLGYLSPVTDAELEAQAKRAGGEKPEIRGTDLVGRSGLEQQYDADLRGRPGRQDLAVDHLGRVTGVVRQEASVPGAHLVTSIDAKVQAAAEQELAAAIRDARSRRDRDTGRPLKADSGAMVVMDHRSGRVLALASYPSYDPAIWTGGISTADYAAITSARNGYPNQARAFQGEFAPASTFKVVSTSAAVGAGYSLYGRYPCPGSYAVGNRVFNNFESRAYGSLPLDRALEISCDTIFYRFGHQLWQRDGGTKPAGKPKEAMVGMAKAWGFGQRTGIDLPSEADGRIADRAWKREFWEATRDASCARAKKGYPELEAREPARARLLHKIARENCVDGYLYRAGDAVNFSIGQGDTTVTPLQLAVAYSALANGGTLWSPRLASAVVRPEGTLVRRITPQARGKLPVSREVLDYMRAALYDVPKAGTARGAFAGFPLDQHPVAGKTGTGEVFGKQNTAWFASFDDRLTIVTMVSQGGTGGSTSAPAVRKMYERIYGLTGAAPLLRGGAPITALPRINDDGVVAASRSRSRR